jgi:hypothetical protein
MGCPKERFGDIVDHQQKYQGQDGKNWWGTEPSQEQDEQNCRGHEQRSIDQYQWDVRAVSLPVKPIQAQVPRTGAEQTS